MFLSSEDTAFLSNAGNWYGAPLFEVQLRLISAYDEERALRALLNDEEISGPFQHPNDILAANQSVEVPEIPQTEGLILLFPPEGSFCPAGARYSLSVMRSVLMLCMYIGPLQVRRACGSFPWHCEGDWVTSDILRFHETLIGVCKRFAQVVPVGHAVLQDEAWVFDVSHIPQGVVIHRDIARAGRMDVAMEADDLAVLPFHK